MHKKKLREQLHELRGALSIIKMNLEILEDNKGVNDPNEKYLTGALSGVEKLRQIMVNIGTIKVEENE